MSTKFLETVLVKNAFKRYANVSFIEKLNELFTELKASGNSRLEVYKGIGLCACNKDKKVFCFVGNKTKDYFTLSYLENENNYYNFYTSCSEVLYNTKLPLNKFYYFSIKPESTGEYKKHKEVSNPIQEYKTLSSKNSCSMEAIEAWLESHENLYTTTVSVIEDKANHFKLSPVELLLNKEFEVLYGKLNILSKLYEKEFYFKQQLEDYNRVKSNIPKLKKWFEYQVENKNKYQLFSLVFYDNRELTHYRLELDELVLKPDDFKYILEYMSIVEDSQATEFEGTIKSISDLEFIQGEYGRNYLKQEIVLFIDDVYCSEYQIIFSDDRVKHLETLSAGQYVKILARLTGGVWINPEGIQEYKYHLFGWRIEKLTSKPKTKENKEDINLYRKYIFPPLF